MDSTQINNSNTLEALDCISRQAAIDAVKKHYRAYDNDLLELIVFYIERLPSAQPKQCKDCALYADHDEWK